MTDEHLREENRILRLWLGEAMYELGRAIVLTPQQVQSHAPPKPVYVTENPVTGELLAITGHGRPDR